MEDVYIFDHVRTPRGRGRPDGALHEIPPVQLAAQTLSALRTRSGFDPRRIDDVGLGIVMPIGEQGADMTRTALLLAGYGEETTGYQMNRFCTSALDTVKMGFCQIAAGQAEAVIGGGVESMSRVAIGSDGGACYTDPDVGARFPYIPNGVAADLLAALHRIDREEVDAYALESQRRAGAAKTEGRFAGSIVAVRDILGDVILAEDEAIRPATTTADLSRLKPSFESVGRSGFDEIVLRKYPLLESVPHIHTGGNSSAIVDGAAAVLLGNAQFGKDTGLRARARILGTLSCASEPLLGLDGPLPATERLLSRLGLRIDDIDLFEVNEAFSVVPLRYMRHFGLSPDRINVNGGAIALGHPLGATGAMLLGTLLDELERRSARRGLVTLCAAAGQSTALVIERT